MTMDAAIRALVWNPRRFSKDIRAHAERFPWGPALAGYALVSFIGTAERILARQPDWSVATILAAAFIGTLVVGAWVQAAVVGGVWMHVGSSIVGGMSSIEATLKVVGYAALVPGALALPGAVVAFASVGDESGVRVLGTLWQALFGVWGFVRTVRVVKSMNDFSVGRALIVAFWFPVFVSTLLWALGLVGLDWVATPLVE